MWCSACQQDVPGVVCSSRDRQMCCARCGKPIVIAGTGAEDGAASHSRDKRADEGLGGADAWGSFPEFVELEDWELEETIRQAEQLVRSVTDEPTHTRSDVPHLAQDSPASSEPLMRNRPQVVVPPKSNGTLPWLMLALGLGLFVCGAALMGLSLVNQQASQWQLGLPLAFAGQVAVLLVVIWQLEVVWNSNRATFVALHALDEQLRRLREETCAGSSHSSEPLPFYRHLADGASPHVLLEDLKRQIDALSAHLAPDRRAA